MFTKVSKRGNLQSRNLKDIRLPYKFRVKHIKCVSENNLADVLAHYIRNYSFMFRHDFAMM